MKYYKFDWLEHAFLPLLVAGFASFIRPDYALYTSQHFLLGERTPQFLAVSFFLMAVLVLVHFRVAFWETYVAPFKLASGGIILILGGAVGNFFQLVWWGKVADFYNVGRYVFSPGDLCMLAGFLVFVSGFILAFAWYVRVRKVHASA